MAMLKSGSCAGVLRRVGARRKLGLPCLQADHQQNYELLPDKPVQQSTDANDFVRETGAPRKSGAFRETVKSLSAFSDIMLSEFQMKLLKQVTAILADAMVPPGAPPSLRLLVRRALRTALLLTHIATVFIRMWALVGAVAHSDPVQGGLATEVELACTVSFLIFSAVGVPSSSSLLRALAAATALVADGRGLGAAAEGLSRMDPQHLDLVASAEEVLDLVSSSAGLLESSQKMVEMSKEPLLNAATARSQQAKQEDSISRGNGGAADGGIEH